MWFFIRSNFVMHLQRQLRQRYHHKVCAIKKPDLDISKVCCCGKPGCKRLLYGRTFKGVSVPNFILEKIAKMLHVTLIIKAYF